VGLKKTKYILNHTNRAGITTNAPRTHKSLQINLTQTNCCKKFSLSLSMCH